MNILVAYFSPTGTTAKIARLIADEVKGDIFEIKPKIPYSDRDLNWKNPLARCNREKALKKDVPIADKIHNFSEYKAVFLGFPIWYFVEPNIIDTFVKSYDWAGKDMYLFATSGGSDISSVKARLRAIAPINISSTMLLNKPQLVTPWLDALAI